MLKKYTLEAADKFVADNRENVITDYRHHYHMMAPVGWMNDPNGFVFYKGEYHLFFQYYPYDSSWGPMHWGHMKSKDLIHWEELPTALAPDQPYDKDGCFSGSAIEKDGLLYLMYTGHVVEDGNVRQTQCIAVSEDGVNFKKIKQNPVIAEEGLGSNGKIADFRDPKAFYRDGSYWIVIPTKTDDNRGRILLYKSKDLISWEFYSVLLEGNESQGIMWECPDLFHIDGKDVLIMSPIQIPKRGYEFHNISSTLAFIGKVDWDTGKFEVENEHEIDAGFDFYAPQTLVDDQDRRIMTAWMQMWDRTLPTHDLGHLWAGAMTLPRVLSVKDSYLVQKPVPQVYENLKITKREEEVVVKDSAVSFEDTVEDNMYIAFTADLSNSEEFSLRFSVDEESELIMEYQKNEGILSIDREHFGYDIKGNEEPQLVKRSLLVPLEDNKIKLELFRDTSSLEVFINDRQTMSTTFYEIEKSRNLNFTSKGTTRIEDLKLGHIIV